MAARPEVRSTAVAPAENGPKTQGEQKLAIINHRFKRLEPHLSAVLPKFITPERMIRVALLAINRNQDLLACTAESLAEAMMTIATWGLEIGRTAHIVAYGDKAQAQADYKGMIELAIRCGSITSCRARVVHERDEFRVEYGLVEQLIHVPTWREDPGHAVGVYAVAGLASGETKFDLMSATDVERIKQRSQSGKKGKGPWATDPEEMWKKTVVKRLLKMVPQNPLLNEALELDDDDRQETATAIRASMASQRHVRSGDYGEPDPPQNILAAPAVQAEPPVPEPIPVADDEIDRELVEREGRA